MCAAPLLVTNNIEITNLSLDVEAIGLNCNMIDGQA